MQAKTELGFHVDCSLIPVDPLNKIKRDIEPIPPPLSEIIAGFLNTT